MKWNRKDIVYASGLFLLLIGGVILAVYLARTSGLNRWIESDANSLKPYETRLVSKGGMTPAASSSPLDAALVARVSERRQVVEISRSEIRKDLWGNRVWVKVHLVTAKPDDEQVRIQIKLLVELEQRGDEWIVTDEKTLAIP